MAAILLPTEWRRQPPQNTPLDKEVQTTLLRSATGVWNLGPGSYNMLTGEQTVLSGTAEWSVYDKGRVGKVKLGSNRIQLAADSRNIVPTTSGFTVALHYRKIGAAAATAGFGLDATASALHRAGTHFPFSDGTLYWDFGGNTAGTSRLTAASLTYGDDFWVFTSGSRGMEIWQNGHLRSSQAGFATWSTVSTTPYMIGMHGTGTQADDAESALCITIARQWSQEETRQWFANPWQIFQSQGRRIYVKAATGGVTGTLATTNANDTSAASGTTTIVGTLAKTNANDTSAASGTTTVLGTLAKTNANDTSAASGAVGSGGSTGTLAYTNANDSVVASGKTTILGVLSKTNANDSVVASGWAGRITGTLAKTNNNDTVVANGTSGTATTTTVAPTEPNSIDWGALVAKTWGKDYVKPEWDYEFSNGRRFLEKKNPYA